MHFCRKRAPPLFGTIQPDRGARTDHMAFRGVEGKRARPLAIGPHGGQKPREETAGIVMSYI